MQSVQRKTSAYGIIGQPVAHSLSPLFQNHFLNEAGLDACYQTFLVEPEKLSESLKELHAASVQGLNVTIPHKEAALSWVNADKDAQIIGAVNTIKRVDESWSAINTDWLGFAAVMQGLEVDTSQEPVLLFGAGGTSRAILHALHHQETKHVYVCNRNSQRAEQLISEQKNHYPNMTMESLAWSEEAVSAVIKNCGLIINCTSIGLKENDVFPFQLQGQGVAIDAVYKASGNTAFRQAAHDYVSTDGLPMLIAQGIASFSFWFASELQKNLINLPNKQVSLQWVEKQLGREAFNLSGWRV